MKLILIVKLTFLSSDVNSKEVFSRGEVANFILKLSDDVCLLYQYVDWTDVKSVFQSIYTLKYNYLCVRHLIPEHLANQWAWSP